MERRIDAMAMVYRIKNWSELYETSESRKRQLLTWVAIPTKHDGKGYRRLMREFGPAVYGAWILICAVAAKCPCRGTLADADGPLEALDISDKTDCPVAVIEQALSALSDKRIGWLELVEFDGVRQIDPKSAGPPAEVAGVPVLPDSTGPDITIPDLPEAGVFSKQDSGEGKKRQSVFAKLTQEHLADPRYLNDWFESVSRIERPVIEFSEANRHRIFGAAVRALMPGKAKKTPVAMFASIVSGARWNEITQANEDEANRRIKALERNGHAIAE